MPNGISSDPQAALQFIQEIRARRLARQQPAQPQLSPEEIEQLLAQIAGQGGVAPPPPEVPRERTFVRREPGFFGALGGGALGSFAGTAVLGPGLGTAVGAGVGALLGGTGIIPTGTTLGTAAGVKNPFLEEILNLATDPVLLATVPIGGAKVLFGLTQAGRASEAAAALQGSKTLFSKYLAKTAKTGASGEARLNRLFHFIAKSKADPATLQALQEAAATGDTKKVVQLFKQLERAKLDPRVARTLPNRKELKLFNRVLVAEQRIGGRVAPLAETLGARAAAGQQALFQVPFAGERGVIGGEPILDALTRARAGLQRMFGTVGGKAVPKTRLGRTAEEAAVGAEFVVPAEEARRTSAALSGSPAMMAVIEARNQLIADFVAKGVKIPTATRLSGSNLDSLLVGLITSGTGSLAGIENTIVALGKVTKRGEIVARLKALSAAGKVPASLLVGLEATAGAVPGVVGVGEAVGGAAAGLNQPTAELASLVNKVEAGGNVVTKADRARLRQLAKSQGVKVTSKTPDDEMLNALSNKLTGEPIPPTRQEAQAVATAELERAAAAKTEQLRQLVAVEQKTQAVMQEQARRATAASQQRAVEAEAEKVAVAARQAQFEAVRRRAPPVKPTPPTPTPPTPTPPGAPALVSTLTRADIQRLPRAERERRINRFVWDNSDFSPEALAARSGLSVGELDRAGARINAMGESELLALVEGPSQLPPSPRPTPLKPATTRPSRKPKATKAATRQAEFEARVAEQVEKETKAFKREMTRGQAPPAVRPAAAATPPGVTLTAEAARKARGLLNADAQGAEAFVDSNINFIAANVGVSTKGKAQADVLDEIRTVLKETPVEAAKPATRPSRPGIAGVERRKAITERAFEETVEALKKSTGEEEFLIGPAGSPSMGRGLLKGMIAPNIEQGFMKQVQAEKQLRQWQERAPGKNFVIRPAMIEKEIGGEIRPVPRWWIVADPDPETTKVAWAAFHGRNKVPFRIPTRAEVEESIVGLPKKTKERRRAAAVEAEFRKPGEEEESVGFSIDEIEDIATTPAAFAPKAPLSREAAKITLRFIKTNKDNGDPTKLLGAGQALVKAGFKFEARDILLKAEGLAIAEEETALASRIGKLLLKIPLIG